MAMTPKPIETSYQGYRFRSRLEARWAVFLNSLGVEWCYEKEGFELSAGRYLPDFWLPYPYGPGWGCWLEIKPAALTEREIALLAELTKVTGHRSFAFCGNPWPGEHSVTVFQHWNCGEPKSVPLIENARLIEGRIHDLRNVYAATDRVGEVAGSMSPVTGFVRRDRDGLQRAFEAARAARFEHGERG